MRFFKPLLPLCFVAVIASQSLFAQDSIRGQETAFERQLKEKDDRPVRDFVQSKENIDVKEKATNLDISGDVRFEWRSLQEKGKIVKVEDGHFTEKYRNLRGGTAVDYRDLPISTNDWDVEFNLKLRYEFENAWAAAHLQYDNSAGVRGFDACRSPFVILPNEEDSSSSSSPTTFSLIRDTAETCKGSGSSNSINLKRAYIGYTVLADGKHRVDVEMGRRKLDDIFTSELQFSSRFDGLLLKYSTALGKFADFYWNVGGFVIDERVNHLGWVTEFGFLNIGDSSIDVRYSYIDWTKRGRNRCHVRDPIGSQFRNSEINFSYYFEPEFYCVSVPAELYGGFVVNHAAKRTVFTHHKKANIGWYMGLYVGEVEKKGDWSFEIEYLWVQAQAVSDCDVGSIGRGNILDDHLTDIIFDANGNVVGNASVLINESEISPSASSSSMTSVNAFLPRRGNANFKGWALEFLYALTDNLSVDILYEISNPVDNKIGGRHNYSVFEIEAIYAF